MKKINSNGYAHKVIAWIFVFHAVIPVILHVLGWFLEAALPRCLTFVSLAIGAVIATLFAGLLGVEFFQDRKIAREYANVKMMKIPLKNGLYECQRCGNALVHSDESHCGVCGARFAVNDNINAKAML